MEEKKKRSFWESFKIWFGLGALMFGTYCGANMASGVYATTYMVTFGGGWMWVCLAIFIAFMAFFCAVSLNFIRAYKVDNYNSYYLALWGADKPGTNPVVKVIVSIFFDVYTTLMGVVTVAATIALFANLMESLFNIPIGVGSIIAVVMFTLLSMYGAAFLRKFNTVMTISLIAALAAILIFVIAMRGDVLAQRMFDFEGGMNWSGKTLASHFGMLVSYCFTTASWGGSLSNYAENIHTKKDAIGSGILIGVMVASLFFVTSLIVLPFLPDAFVATPILSICKEYMPGVMTAIYWLVVMLSVISTGPTFIFNTSNRFVKVWKTEKVPQRVKLFVIALAFLLLCLALSKIGLIAICGESVILLIQGVSAMKETETIRSAPRTEGTVWKAFRATAPQTLPVFAGYLVLGLGYGIYVQSLGLPVWLPPLMGTVVYGGSLEFVLASLLLGSFAPVSAFLMALMIQARHLFYGLTMLQRYRGYGLRSAYMIFAMSDETFSITCSAEPPEGVDKGWFMFFITLLDQIYWVASAAMGAALGSVLPFSTEGVDFVMTAMFVVIFLNQWEKEKQHASAIIGIAAPLVCLRIFGSGSFLIPSMVCILAALLLLRRPIEAKESEAAK